MDMSESPASPKTISKVNRRSSKWKNVQRKFKLTKNQTDLSQDDLQSVEQKCQQEISDMTQYFIERRGLFKIKKHSSLEENVSLDHDCQTTAKKSRSFHPNDNRHKFLKRDNVIEEVTNSQKPDMDSLSSF